MPARSGHDPRSGPLAYLLTFTCYGTKPTRLPTYRLRPPADNTTTADRADPLDGALHRPPYALDAKRRQIVLRAFREAAALHGWTILAAHIRVDGVQLVITAADPPQSVLRDLKALASRRLRQQTSDPPGCKRWTRNDSTGYLTTVGELRRAINYTTNQLGPPMSIYDGNQVWPTV